MARRLAAAGGVAVVAFTLYHATLLPGLDFGDTGFFQATVGSPVLTPRDGYPLYFAIGAVFLWITGAEPARALNLASAIQAAIACGLLVLVAAELSGSVLAAIAASLLFAVSYTFWSQAIIAEVYALHAVFVCLTILLALAWADRPTLRRLAIFFAAYALGFGNHLSMILLLPGFAAFLLLAAPDGWRSMLRPPVVGLAAAIAVAGALQYAWNIRGLWEWPNQPTALADALRTFWFDVTKSDWRETMVVQLPRSMIRDRLAMYGFDLVQQFGWAVLLAPLGLARLFAVNRRRAVLMLVLYLANAAFAFTYNVGDTHVFYLPSHLVLAMLIAPGIVWLATRARPIGAVVSILVIAYGVMRAYNDYPALDRSEDRRPTAVLTALTDGLDDRRAILLADSNWQLVNGLAYFGKVTRPDLAYAWLTHVLQYAPALVRDNLAIHREVALTDRARASFVRAYGPLFEVKADPRVGVPTLTEIVRPLPRDTRYVLCFLRPSRDLVLDRDDLAAALRALTARDVRLPSGDYVALVGAVGREPALLVGSATPFRREVRLDGAAVEVRMDSWLAFDTIRRMGFGHAIVDRHHTLIIERGVSFATFDAEGRARQTAYFANIFAPQPRFIIMPSFLP